MKIEKSQLNEILKDYKKIKKEIEKKIEDFKKIGTGSKDDILKELYFCLLTPQSKAEVCWKKVQEIDSILSKNEIDCRKLADRLSGIRFHRTKAIRLIEARHNIEKVIEVLGKYKNPCRIRKWLVKNVNGIGMKEASHFLRNTGKSGNLAILDRHIIRKMHKLRIIKEIPDSLNEKKYLEIEKKLQRFASEIKIPVSHLDFVFWYQETGRIFK